MRASIYFSLSFFTSLVFYISPLCVSRFPFSANSRGYYSCPYFLFIFQRDFYSGIDFILSSSPSLFPSHAQFLPRIPHKHGRQTRDDDDPHVFAFRWQHRRCTTLHHQWLHCHNDVDWYAITEILDRRYPCMIPYHTDVLLLHGQKHSNFE